MSKGSTRRPGDDTAYARNWDAIFGVSDVPSLASLDPETLAAINAHNMGALREHFREHSPEMVRAAQDAHTRGCRVNPCARCDAYFWGEPDPEAPVAPLNADQIVAFDTIRAQMARRRRG